MSETGTLRSHERDLIDALGNISANVVPAVAAHDFTHIADESKEMQFATDEASLLRVLTITHARYLRAAGYPGDLASEAAKRAAAELEHILTLAQTLALDRLAEFMTKTEAA